jgi:hypothetical protein
MVRRPPAHTRSHLQVLSLRSAPPHIHGYLTTAGDALTVTPTDADLVAPGLLRVCPIPRGGDRCHWMFHLHSFEDMVWSLWCHRPADGPRWPTSAVGVDAGGRLVLTTVDQPPGSPDPLASDAPRFRMT